jgi:hypothetical protein
MARCGGEEDQRTDILHGLASKDAAASPRRDVEKNVKFKHCALTGQCYKICWSLLFWLIILLGPVLKENHLVFKFYRGDILTGLWHEIESKYFDKMDRYRPK